MRSYLNEKLVRLLTKMIFLHVKEFESNEQYFVSYLPGICVLNSFMAEVSII